MDLIYLKVIGMEVEVMLLNLDLPYYYKKKQKKMQKIQHN